ncbi:tRNA(Ile)-lysidine synthase [Shimia thalassica]|uniref:tRNA(Ile)-lysidine synthase n=1 Tax=Shimia thalassica TaxID=1715693 RepID=A0A0P1I377_9RHOB|nr:tRNA lysidine(34) synthetase TilS [Shimia thalassica]CUJ87168.1 tRNA(Ile)-lysidine synthase [Shimia thalassica]
MSQSEISPEHAVSEFLASLPGLTLGVAVSGGSDSLALLHLVHEWARLNHTKVVAATVDHGLRPEAAGEARQVAGVCDGLGVSHTTLTWQGAGSGGNIQSMARDARYRLLADWAKNEQVDFVLLGHTQDDLAENLLIRLARRAGVDGLASMDDRFERQHQRFARPMLDVSRAHLQSYLQDRDIQWVDDPSNEDEVFDRVRARRALVTLADVGIDSSALAQVSRNMSDAKVALHDQMADLAWTHARIESGDLLIRREAFTDVPVEISRRLLLVALQWVSGNGYAARREPLVALLRSIQQNQGGTLQGCLVTVDDQNCRIGREYAAVKSLSAVDGIWDGRWNLEGPYQPGFEVRALGEEGLRQVPDWRESGLVRSSLIASPAVWGGDMLVAAPLAGYNKAWSAKLLPERAVFLP